MMNNYNEGKKILEELFSKDCVFAFATACNNKPSVRIVDTYYEDECFYIVVGNRTQKVNEVEVNKYVSLCHEMYRFNGVASNIGHPLKPENKQIREKLMDVFKPWYLPHNDEGNEEMCYIKVELTDGFFHHDGIGYNVDFVNKQISTFPFAI